MTLKYCPYTIELRHRFTISTASRTSTPAVLVRISLNNYTGYGEASLPPYLKETQQSVTDFLSRIDLSGFTDAEDISKAIDYTGSHGGENNAARAAIDIALHDLKGKILSSPLYRILGVNKDRTPYTSFTIGIDEPHIVEKKIIEAQQFRFLKIKLGTQNDHQIIKTIRSFTDKPLYTDANQGWTDRGYALEMVHMLAENNVLLIEQPMPADSPEDNAWLTARSPLPVIADEAVKTSEDIGTAAGVYSGINIKLMKSGGIGEALKMISEAQRNEMKIMLGCMTETTCAISAAAHLSPLCDFADLDGSLLTSNDPFEGVDFIDGKIILNDFPGTGCRLKSDYESRLQFIN